MAKVWLVKQESCVDGVMIFNVVPCASEERAKEVMAKEVETLLNEGHFSTARPYIDGEVEDMDDCDFVWENENEYGFYINDLCDDYHELIVVEEKEIQY